MALVVVRTSKAVAAPRDSTRWEVAIQKFTNSNLTSDQLRELTAPLLNSKNLLRNVLGLTPEDQTKFVDKVDQARRDRLIPSWNLPFTVPTKAYSTIDPQNVKFATALGSVCSAIERLPTSAVLSAGLEKRGYIVVALGELTDV